MKPTGRHKKVYEQGRKAFRDGRLLTDNPYTKNRVSFSSWWEAGFLCEYRKTMGELRGVNVQW